MEEILTLREVASYLKLSELTVLRLANRGLIPGAKIGKQWRFARENVRSLIHSPEIMASMGCEKVRTRKCR